MTAFKRIENAVKTQKSVKTKFTASCAVNNVQVFSTNSIWDKMAQKIRNATSHVCISGYKFHGKSKSGQKILQSLRDLREKSKHSHQKIKVNLLINKRGKWAEKIYKKNYDVGLDDFINENKSYPNFEFEIRYHEAKALNSYHAKQLIVDAGMEGGAVMLCGGDIQSENDDPKKQYETAILLEGQEIADIAVQDFQEAFDSCLLPVLKKNHHEDFDTPVKSTGTQTIYLSSQAKSLPFENKQQAPYKTAILESIHHAQKTVNILTANLNDPDIVMALAQAANRGVKIKIAMTKHKNDRVEKFFGGTNEESVRKIDSLIKPENKKNFRVHWSINPDTTKLVKSSESYMMHGKFCMVDENILLMGSSPLDRQAMVCSREVDVCLNLEKEKSQEVLDSVFYTPYAFGRDYYVDQVITKLNNEIIRLNRKNTRLSYDKATRLEGLVQQLSIVGTTPYDAYEILHKEETLMIKEKMKDKEHTWDLRSTKSETSIEACYKIIKNCCKGLEVVKSTDDIEENIKMKHVRGKYFSNESATNRTFVQNSEEVEGETLSTVVKV